MSRVSQPTPLPEVTPESEVFWKRLENPAGQETQRQFPRVHANVPVRVVLASGEAVDLVSNDVSVVGLQVRCDLETARRVSPKSPTTAPVTLALELTLVVGGAPVPARAHGQLAHVTPVPGEARRRAVAMGFTLTYQENDDHGVVQRFVEQHLQPA